MMIRARESTWENNCPPSYNRIETGVMKMLKNAKGKRKEEERKARAGIDFLAFWRKGAVQLRRRGRRRLGTWSLEPVALAFWLGKFLLVEGG